MKGAMNCERTHVVVGVGMSTQATGDEVATLVRQAMEHHGFEFPPSAIATRAVFVDDKRLEFGCPVIGFDDGELVANSKPVDRTVGVPARVAETAATLAAGAHSSVATPIHRSAHTTVAVAITTGEPHQRRRRTGAMS
jgi:cobalamin biosynthesis protein CbiG